MEERRPRPGDRLDDYCTRERRLTDHVVVAVVDATIKQTRCVACDTEHPFKGGSVPSRQRLKKAVDPAPEGTEVAVDEESMPNLVTRPEKKPAKTKKRAPVAPAPPLTPLVAVPVVSLPVVDSPAGPVAAAALSAPNGAGPNGAGLGNNAMVAVPAAAGAEPQPASFDDEGPVHRRLIRATLPRPEGEVPTRPLPDFTMRQYGARNGGGNGRPSQRPFFNQGHRSGPWSSAPQGPGGSRAGASMSDHGGGRGRNRSRGNRKKSR